MFYRIINSEKLKIFRTAFSILLIVSCITTFSSCMNTYSYVESAETVEYFLSDSTAEITKIELINGMTINCTDKILKFETGVDSLKYLVIKSYVTGSDKSVYRDIRKIPENEISGINIEKSEVNVTKTIFFVLGIATVAFILGYIIATVSDPDTFKFNLIK